MPPGRGSDRFAGTLTGERWPAVQADSAATHTAAAAATTLTARMLIRRTTARPGCAGVVRRSRTRPSRSMCRASGHVERDAETGPARLAVVAPDLAAALGLR